jgi:glucose-1-phosphate cytidylyltransferase
MSEFTPKPMIPIGGLPMVAHIMRRYAKYGFKEFVLALGYKQEAFKLYFSHYSIINEDIILYEKPFLANPGPFPPNFDRVVLSDTGADTLKGGRLKRVEKYIDGDTFMCTYGDGIGDINIHALLDFHKSHGRVATVTGVHPKARFGEIYHKGPMVTSFSEKPHNGDCLVNGGFFVFNRAIFDYLTPDKWCDLEAGPLEILASKGEMMVYQHPGQWFCMDTLAEMDELNRIWDSGTAPWKV